MNERAPTLPRGLGAIIDARLLREAREFSFRFGCPSCAYYDEERERCSEGYPSEAHRSEKLESERLIFCKLYEGA